MQIETPDGWSLSEAGVRRRLASYDAGGTAERVRRWVWDICGPAIIEGVEAHFASASATANPISAAVSAHYADPHAYAKTCGEASIRCYSQPFNDEWVRSVAKVGAQLEPLRLTSDQITSDTLARAASILGHARRVIGDGEAFGRLSRAVLRGEMIALEIILAEISSIRRRRERDARTDISDAFRAEVVTIIDDTALRATAATSQMVQAADAARGMLDKASDVSAASRESAVAMRDAAATAGGLIRAIETARAEVEASSQIASRASDEALSAVEVADELSGHAQAIESILGLIRDVAAQTNLLALNATIEAARAGDAGRGFAVVAQEVKSLASQTARATDEIAAKIAAIQAASERTLAANGRIRDIVGDVQSSAERNRATMEVQAQTVTAITAAVDQTALAAESMSSTISAIRVDIRLDRERHRLGRGRAQGCRHPSAGPRHDDGGLPQEGGRLGGTRHQDVRPSEEAPVARRNPAVYDRGPRPRRCRASRSSATDWPPLPPPRGPASTEEASAGRRPRGSTHWTSAGSTLVAPAAR